MTVKELIELLGQLPQDALVILSSDEEGNNYSPITPDYSLGHYIADSTWSGEFWDAENDESTHEDCDHDEEGDEICDVVAEPPEGAVPAVVLWPTN